MIQTTHGKAFGAFVALNQIRGMVKGMDALHVFHMKNKLKESVDFFCEEEIRMVQEAGGNIAESGLVIFPDEEKKQAYIVERKGLDDLPCEIQADPIKIVIDRVSDITCEQIEKLDGFVEFIPETEG